MTPFSSIDYPGKLAAVLFCQGCPLRCAYCHNPALLPFEQGQLTWPEVMDFLARRRGLLEAVVFSGGEPLAQAGLESALAEVRALGFKIGLHTAGTHTARLRRILPLCDWIGLDIKAPLARYPEITGREVGRHTFAALAAIMQTGLDYEVRTTVDHALLSTGDLMALAKELAGYGLTSWVLQTHRQHALAAASSCSEELRGRLQQFVPSVLCR